MRPSSIAIRVFQALLLVVGIGWVLLVSKTHLDDTQVPGFLIAMAISWWLTPEIRARAMRLGLVDKPGEERRIHKVPIPRLGGVAIYIGVMLTMGLLIALTGRFPRDARGSEGGLAGIAVGGTLIFVLGLLDDLESIPAKVKLLVQILAASSAYSLGVRIKYLPIPGHFENVNLGFMQIPLDPNTHGFSLGWMSWPLTVLWLVGIANAVNLIDGMDGLAAGVSAISALTIWSVSLATSIDRPYAALLGAVLAGALLGFLRWNFNPARIFLGDSGAYLVGFVLGAISIMGVIKGATAFTVIVPTFVLVLLILFFPILDTSWAIVRRVAKRRSIFEPDAGHIHHRLLQAGLSQKKVAYLIYLVSAILGLIAASLVNQQKYFLILTGVVLTMAVFFAEVLNRHHNRPRPSRGQGGGDIDEVTPPGRGPTEGGSRRERAPSSPDDLQANDVPDEDGRPDQSEPPASAKIPPQLEGSRSDERIVIKGSAKRPQRSKQKSVRPDNKD